MSDKRPQCEHCHRSLEKGCDGRGNIQVLDVEDTVRRCPNHKVMALAVHLGPEIAGVRHVKNSPLLELNSEGGQPIEDRTNENLIIRCAFWHDILPHLKWVLAYKGLQYFFKIIDDLRIKNVFVGAESYRSRPMHARDEVATYNTVGDLVAEPDLLIIRLGQLGYQNRAAGGALKEALLCRSALNKPTWLVVDDHNGWGHSSGADVEYYVNTNFEEIRIETDPAYQPPPHIRTVGIDISTDEDFEELPTEVEDESPSEQEGQFNVDMADMSDWGLPGANDDKPSWKKR